MEGLGEGEGYIRVENIKCSLLCLQLVNGAVKKLWVSLRLWEGWRSALQEEMLVSYRRRVD